MRIIVASDIHGVTPELRLLASRFGMDAELLSPWAFQGRPFESEAEAHAAFIASGGVESYAEKIADAAACDPVFIVGFSAGATAAWLYASTPECSAKSRAMLYYGSRIRLYPNMTPRCRVRIIFAEHEPGFKPAELALDIRRKNVIVEVEENSLHGFMNPLSPGYSADLTDKHVAAIRNELSAV